MRALRMAALILAAVALPTSGAAGAEPCPADPGARLRPCGLEVVGGKETWRSDNVFSLRWRNPPADSGPPIVAVHYRLRDPAGVALGETTIGWDAESIERLPVPFRPGVYTAEVWLEDAAGDLGPPATAELRFDDARPGHVDPLSTSGWIGRPAFPHAIRLGHPAGPQPLSGIRGYAVAIDRSAAGDPCMVADRCSETETDLQGGTAEDTLSLAELPEGTSYVHAVAVSGSGMKSASIGHSVLRVDTTDPVTTLSGLPSGWTNRWVNLVATATDSASGMSASGAAKPFTAIRIDDGAPIVASGDSVKATVIAPGIHTIAYYARDAAGNVDDGGSANGHANPSPTTATVRIDTEPPRVAFANAQKPQDPERIEARVFDLLSGPDGPRGQISVRRADSGDRFEALPTAVDGDGMRARWDSDAYLPGRYEFRATGFDLAGNASATTRRANGARMILSAPLKRSTELRAGFGGSSTLHLRPFGRGALLSGRLIGGRRVPLAAMPVRVIERFASGSSPPQRVSTVRTDAGGAFTVRLPPGPSRSIVAVFMGTATLSRSQSQPLQLDVRGGVRMRASSSVAPVGGRPIVFRGRVLAIGGPIPPGGKYVQLQFRLPDTPWTEFRTIRTDPRGRFRYAYRFSDDDSRGVRFQFRAYAPAQSDWPYEAGASRPVAVKGL